MTRGTWRMPLRWQAAWSQASWVGVRLMIGYRALELGADVFVIAVVAASFALPAMIAALPAGRFSDRYGGTTLSATGLGIAMAGILAAGLVSASEWLVIAAIVVGLGHLFVMVGQQSLVAHVAAGGESDGAFGTFTAAASVGQLIGPPMVTAAATLSPGEWQARAGLLACFICALAAICTARSLRRHDPRVIAVRDPRVPSMPMADLGRSPGVVRALLVGAAVITTVDLIYSFLPLWGEERGIPMWIVGTLLALRAAVSVASRIGLGSLVRRFGRRSLLVTSLAIGATSVVAMPFVNVWGATLVMFGLGIALGLPQPLTMSWITGVAPATEHGAVLGVRMTVNRTAQLLLPLAVGVFATPLGTAAVFLATGALLGTAAVIASTSGPAALPPGRPTVAD